MDSQIIDLYLKDKQVFDQWQAFLTSLNITNFSPREVDQLDFTIGIYDGEQLVATGSVAGNVLKYVGVCNKNVTAGVRFNLIVSELVNRLFRQNVFHLMVFTKRQYSASFQHVGFSELAHTDEAAVLETGSPTVDDYLARLPRPAARGTVAVAAVVINANPFTLGHRFLIEQAARENVSVYVFVVATDASLFTTAERLELVRAGTRDLPNVIVVDGGDYMVSYATFPAYFLPSPSQTVRYQTTLDARIFRDAIAPALAITTRYVGSEPRSHTTAIYNQVLQIELPPRVTVKVVERYQTSDHVVISASRVRQALRNNDFETISAMVPATTAAFIHEHYTDLTQRAVAAD